MRDRVLLEKFPHKLLGISKRQQIPCWPQIFLGHRLRKIEDQNKMSDDAALQRRRVLQEPVRDVFSRRKLNRPDGAVLPLSLPCFKQSFNRRADCPIRALHQSLPGPGELPLCAPTLLSLPGSHAFASGDLKVVFILGYFADVLLVRIGHGVGVGAAQCRVCWCASGALCARDCLERGPSSGGAPSVTSAFAPFAWETSPVLCQ